MFDRNSHTLKLGYWIVQVVGVMPAVMYMAPFEAWEITIFKKILVSRSHTAGELGLPS